MNEPYDDFEFMAAKHGPANQKVKRSSNDEDGAFIPNKTIDTLEDDHQIFEGTLMMTFASTYSHRCPNSYYSFIQSVACWSYWNKLFDDNDRVVCEFTFIFNIKPKVRSRLHYSLHYYLLLQVLKIY